MSKAVQKPRGDLRDFVTFRQIVTALRRNALWMAVLFIVINLAAMTIAVTLPPIFRATATVVIDSRNRNVAPVQSILSPLEATVAVVQTELEMLRSPELTQYVIKDVGRKTAAAAVASTPHPIQKLHPKRILSLVFSTISIDSQGTPAKDDAESRLIAKLLEKLDLYNQVGTYGIKISFSSEDPKLAADIANAYAKGYVEAHLREEREAQASANLWLKERLEDLHTKMLESDQKLEMLRQESGLIESRGMTVSAQQVVDLNSRLVESRTQRHLAEARYRSVQALVQVGRAETAPEVLDSEAIQRLKQQESDLLKQRAERSEQYGDLHPTIVNIDAQLESLRASIEAETKRVVERLANEVELARVRERELARALGAAEGQVAKASMAEVGASDLQHEADINRTLYEEFLTRYKETENSVLDPGVKIAAVARPPLFPSAPNKPVIATLGFLGSAFLEIILLLIIAKIPKPLRSSSELEEYLGLATLGVMPAEKLSASRDVRALLVGNPRSALAESMNSILAKVNLQFRASPVKILITSGLPGEGKTTLALALAVASAQSGKRVCLVDIDLVRKGLSTTLLPIEADHQTESIEIREFSVSSWEDQLTNIVMVTLWPSDPKANHNRLLSSPTLNEIIENLSLNTDLVVIDSPPVLAVVDPLIICRVVDAIVLAVRWGQSTVDEVQHAIKELDPYHEKIVGGVLTLVDMNRHSEFGFKDRSYYYSRVRGYYDTGPASKDVGRSGNRDGHTKKAPLPVSLNADPGDSQLPVARRGSKNIFRKSRHITRNG